MMLRRRLFDLRVLVSLLIAGVLVAEIADYISAHPVIDITDLLLHLYTTFRAEVVTLVLAILIMIWIQNKSTLAQEKRALLIQLGSPDHSFAVEAARVLRVRGWVTDGSLKGLFLANANLSGAGLWNADLQEAQLMGAQLDHANLHRANLYRAQLWEAHLGQAELMEVNLRKANLRKASLRGAKLWEADLCGAVLEFADLTEAHLRNANLRNALLNRADLRGANFSKTNLQGASLHHAIFDERTVLPDGIAWSPQVDLSRFTNPDHADFWRPQADDENVPVWLNNKADEDEESIAFAWAS